MAKPKGERKNRATSKRQVENDVATRHQVRQVDRDAEEHRTIALASEPQPLTTRQRGKLS